MTGYLYHAERNALDLGKEILPTVADIKAHPLPALQDLTADPFSHRTIKDTTSEITCHLERIANTRKSYALEDFYSWYQNFLDAVQRLYEKKIAVCDTLGKTDVKRKLIEALAILPKSSAPEEFKISFRRALMLDAEATEEINGVTETAAHGGLTKTQQDNLLLRAVKYSHIAAARKKCEFEANAKGGRKGAKTRNEEAAHDKTKETIRHEVNAMKADWDKRYPDRHKRGNKDHSDNMIYRTIASKHTKANGDPLYTWGTIKSWYTHPKRSKKSSNK